ncbi:MAG: NAD(P)H-binding protein [Pseudomonadota bacterium]
MKISHALVLGGNGFIGTALVNQLRCKGIEVLVGTRAKNRCLRAGERRICFHTAKRRDWINAIEGCQLVINAVGILRQRWKETYEQVHHEAVKELANACAEKNVRLIHISVLGLEHKVKSRFLLSKLKGETALSRSGADWLIVRPSLLEGEAGYGARWFRRLANWPIHFTPADAIGRVAPLHVNEFASLVIDIAVKNFESRVHELGGNRILSFDRYLAYLSDGKPRINIKVPGFLVRLFSHVFDLLHLTPLSYGHYELMKNDNIPRAATVPTIADDVGV